MSFIGVSSMSIASSLAQAIAIRAVGLSSFSHWVMASPLPLEELWHSALVSYGLERPTEHTEIHVFRVILQASLDKTACTRSVTTASPVSDPVQTLEQIIEEWWDLEVDLRNPSWRLTAVNGARSWSPNKT